MKLTKTDIETLKQHLRDLVGILTDTDPESVNLGDDLGVIGVDSMMRLEIIAHVEQFLGHQIPEHKLPDLRNLNEVVQYVEAMGFD